MFYSIMDRSASIDGRLFLAALPDAITAARIFRLAGALKRAHRFSGKLIAPDRLHVSLLFLGGLQQDMECAAREAGGEIRMAVSGFFRSNRQLSRQVGKPAVRAGGWRRRGSAQIVSAGIGCWVGTRRIEAARRHEFRAARHAAL